MFLVQEIICINKLGGADEMDMKDGLGIASEIILDDIKYILYRKSIEVEGIGIFFFSHKVSEKTAKKLHRLYQIGRAKKNEFK